MFIAIALLTQLLIVLLVGIALHQRHKEAAEAQPQRVVVRVRRPHQR